MGIDDRRREMRILEAKAKFSQDFEKFRQDVNGAMQFAPLDRFQQPIREGDFVLYSPPVDVVYRVMSIKPMLDPRAPTGALEVLIQAQVPVLLQQRTPSMNLLVLKNAEPPAVDTPPPGVDTPARDAGSESTPADPSGDPGPARTDG